MKFAFVDAFPIPSSQKVKFIRFDNANKRSNHSGIPTHNLRQPLA
jgi:hypothetical protein